MKKQLSILLLALFAVSYSFAQTPHDPPTCTGSAASPAVGVDYIYEVTVPATQGYTGNGNYTWYVTQNVNLLAAGAAIANNSGEFIASGAGAYNTPNAGADVINITWTSAALADGQPYYLVVIYDEAAVCATNNVKVYRIIPQNTFYLAVDNITTSVCAAAVVSATISGEPNTPEVEYIFGVNTLTFTITAGGYLGNFDAQLQLGGFDNEQTLVATWAATRAGTNGTFTAPGTINGIYTASLPAYTDATGGTETITVTLTVDNHNFENLDGQSIAIAVDGSYSSGAIVFNDKSDVNGLCSDETAFADALTQTIAARPTINPVTPAGFVNSPTLVTP